MDPLNSIDRRYLYALYWLLFACFSVFGAESPGYVMHPETVPFPWLGLVVVWVMLALGVGVIYAILGPRISKTSWPRFGGALAFSGALLVFCILTFVTDMPGLYYIPTWFSLITFGGLTIIGVARAVVHVWGHYQNAP